MDNVIQFPGRIENNKIVKPEEFNTWLESCNFPTIIHNIVNQLPSSLYLKDLPLQWRDVTEWSQNEDTETGLGEFLLSSSLRRQLVPKFGNQSYVEYAWINYGYVEQEPEAQPLPDNLLDQLKGYIDSYPETICPNAAYCYGLLSGILDQPDLNFIEILHIDDQLIVSFYEKQSIENHWMILSFCCDFIPMILDDAAIAFNATRDYK